MRPLSKLLPRKQRYAEELAKGSSKKDALLKAGYSESVAMNPHMVETPDFKAAFAEVMRKKISAERIAQKISDGMEAKETHFFSKDGLVIDSRDVIAWGEQRRFTELAALYGGLYTPKQEVDVTQKLDEGTARRLANIAEKIGITELEYDERKELRKSYVVLDAQTSEDSASTNGDSLVHQPKANGT